MNASVKHFKLTDKGEVQYDEKGIPMTEITSVMFPISFGYVNYNKPRSIIGPNKILVENIISIAIENGTK